MHSCRSAEHAASCFVCARSSLSYAFTSGRSWRQLRLSRSSCALTSGFEYRLMIPVRPAGEGRRGGPSGKTDVSSALLKVELNTSTVFNQAISSSRYVCGERVWKATRRRTSWRVRA